MHIRAKTKAGGSLRFNISRAESESNIEPQTSDRRGRGPYMHGMHPISMVHVIYTMIYGQLSPLQLVNYLVMWFSVCAKIRRVVLVAFDVLVFGILLLVFSVHNGTVTVEAPSRRVRERFRL